MSAVAMNREVLPQKQDDLLDQGLSSFVKGGFVLLLVASLDLVVAWRTPYWVTYDGGDGDRCGVGLWGAWCCPESSGPLDLSQCEHKTLAGDLPGWYTISKWSITTALLGTLVTLVLLLIYGMNARCMNRTIIQWTIFINYVAGLSLLVGVALFGANIAGIFPGLVDATSWTFSWSFSLGCTSLIVLAISVCVIAMENKRLKRLVKTL